MIKRSQTSSNFPGHDNLKRKRQKFLDLLEEIIPSSHPCYRLWKEAALNAVQRGQVIVQTMTSNGLCIKGKRVLDVGCGSCGIYIAFAQSDAEVVGIDVSKKNLKLGKARILEENLEGSLILASAQNLPLKDYSFDVVICNDVIEHVENPVDCAKNVSSVLKTSGILWITAPNILSLANFLSDPHFKLPLISILPPFIGKKIQQKTKRGNEEIKMFTTYGLMKLLRSVGFCVFIPDDADVKKKIMEPWLVQKRIYRYLLSILKYFRAQLLALWLSRMFWNRSIKFICIKNLSNEAIVNAVE